MTDLEKSVAYALRLSTASATELLPEIQRNIDTAGAELIRSGVAEDVITAGGNLVEDAIIQFCLIRMGDESTRDYAERSFLYAQENLRKS